MCICVCCVFVFARGFDVFFCAGRFDREIDIGVPDENGQCSAAASWLRVEWGALRRPPRDFPHPHAQYEVG